MTSNIESDRPLHKQPQEKKLQIQTIERYIRHMNKTPQTDYLKSAVLSAKNNPNYQQREESTIAGGDLMG